MTIQKNSCTLHLVPTLVNIQAVNIDRNPIVNSQRLEASQELITDSEIFQQADNAQAKVRKQCVIHRLIHYSDPAEASNSFQPIFHQGTGN